MKSYAFLFACVLAGAVASQAPAPVTNPAPTKTSKAHVERSAKAKKRHAAAKSSHSTTAGRPTSQENARSARTGKMQPPLQEDGAPLAPSANEPAKTTPKRQTNQNKLHPKEGECCVDPDKPNTRLKRR